MACSGESQFWWSMEVDHVVEADRQFDRGNGREVARQLDSANNCARQAQFYEIIEDNDLDG